MIHLLAGSYRPVMSLTALIVTRLSVLCFLVLIAGVSHADLAQTFREPPPQARPHTFWFWMNGNMTPEGLTADLEAMARVGIGGVLIMEVGRPGNMAPEGPVKFASPEWRKLFQHVIREAERLGLQVSMNNDAGWAGSGGPWITPEQSMKKLAVTTTTVTGPAKIDIALRKPKLVENFYRDVVVLAVEVDESSATAAVPREKILDISDRMTSAGQLQWDAPAGKWQVVRIGYTSTGRKNKPPPASGMGLECDKFDASAIEAHFDAFIGKLVDDNRSAVGKVFTHTHIDSWEVGPQNWTANMAEEFRKRRGYDLKPWLVALTTQQNVGTADETERFRRDFNRTCAELNDEYYAGALRKISNHHGLKLSIEAYGQGGFLNPLTYGAEAELPISEFWIARWGGWHLLSSRLLSSVAHVYGKQIVGSESFTSWADNDPFTEHPYSVKTTGDWAFCEGVNRIIFHRTVNDPWKNLLPGMSFAGFGWHVDRNQTWFEQSRAYMKYLARCQALLQSGTYVADVCRLVTDGEDHGHSRGMRLIEQPYEPLPPGYGYDYISDKALIEEMGVKEGLLTTRAGMKYRVLQLPTYTTMTMQLANKVHELVQAGAVVVGPKPERSPSLESYPAGDEQVRTLAGQAWDTSAKNHVISDSSISQVLQETAGGADFQYVVDPPVTDASLKSITGRGEHRARGEQRVEMPTGGLNWIHRRVEDADIYFVANPQHRKVSALCTFRIKGKQPELWDPMTGRMRNAAVFTETPRGTQVPVELGPADSIFVVFRQKVDPSIQVVEVRRGDAVLFGENEQRPVELPAISNLGERLETESAQPGHYKLRFADGREAVVDVPDVATSVSIDGPWAVSFQPGHGAPETTEFAELSDWSKHPQEGIRYFSGTATYRTRFDVPSGTSASQRWMLDLGDVQVMAEVRVNDWDVGVLWKPPFVVEVTDALRTGSNELEVKVTNLWPNRLIGDEQFPDDSTPRGTWTKGPIPAWPDWLLKGHPRSEKRRITFTTWKYFTKDSPLISSGLLGPVNLRRKQTHVVQKKELPAQ